MQPVQMSDMVQQDSALGLVTVICPKCGCTAGVLPGSDTWHSRCDGVRMEPVDPQRAEVMRKRAQHRMQETRRRERRRGVSVDPTKQS